MWKLRCIVLAIAAAFGNSAAPGSPAPSTVVLQLYTYQLKDRPKFEQGYREHLRWHVAHADKLPWFAWIVQSGSRRGIFIDGTAGVSFSQLDARPAPAEDSADFTRTAAPYASPLNVETWGLWEGPSTATPLEKMQPSKIVDVFHIRTRPSDANNFERLITQMARRSKSARLPVSWYRQIRGGDVASYMVMIARSNWRDIDAGSPSLASFLSTVYHADQSQLDVVLSLMESANVETWSYEPRLSLMPGTPLRE